MNIYFDMDGVLADFNTATGNAKDLNHPSSELSPEKRAEKKQFWLNIEQNHTFWADIPVMKNIKDLLNIAKSKGEIFVLSKTPSAKHFVAGQDYVDFVASEKRKWILKKLGNFFDNEHIIICDGDKGKLIQPSKNDILVDDRSENITEWESCGGRGLLFVNSVDTKQELY
ncbi:MAG: hypothetical protein UIC65_02790 [Alphaproteobacteria bacterium]|nr:hypothetical protein [Alphaproteobacteria bacterium]